MRWHKQSLYVMRDATGVIVRMQEEKPDGYMSTYEERLKKAYRATEDAEKQITEYARRKINEKKRWMGGD